MHPVERYLRDVSDVRRSGAGTDETSYYPALASLLSEVGKELKPWVRAVSQLKNRGTGQPDFGLFEKHQFQRAGELVPLDGQKPTRGVVEAKGASGDVRKIAAGPQVAKYLSGYGSVLVTSLREFLLVGEGTARELSQLESFSLAKNEAEFWAEVVAHPRRYADRDGDRLLEFLKRVLLHRAPLSAPQDVAWFLASYAREAKARVEAVGDLPALAATRTALEESLGIRFEGEKGDHFFRSTLVQTLFYGVFSAWVLWSREHPPGSKAEFDWQKAAWTLRVPTIRALFSQVATPDRLGPLGIAEVLDWASTRLNDVDRAAFFEKFGEEHAVQHFYEPFLQAFDPELRKRLGVWYTPPEVVKYMVARVDTVLREELDIPDGLADPRVHVLDPCCGTGAFLVEVLRKIAETLRAKGSDALVASDLRKAARERVHGFELLPAPFVIAHLQLGILLENEGAPLSHAVGDRVGVYLTNALTGWEPPKPPKSLIANPFSKEAYTTEQSAHSALPELAEERAAATKVKREAPILVVLGNPPYDGFAGMAEVAEERILADAYRETKHAPEPQGQGLNDLYVRFFRMAERKIVEDTKRGVVCFISNYSWLDGLSYTGMRERYLEVFDKIWIDCLNGDKYRTGKLTPDGKPDPSIFSTEWNREGIQVGTAIATLVRKSRSSGNTSTVAFRHYWGKDKREALTRGLAENSAAAYQSMTPEPKLGIPLYPMQTTKNYAAWPTLPELFPVSFPGVKTSRDELLVDIDRDRLTSRITAYFDPSVSDEEMRRLSPCSMETRTRFDAKKTRLSLQQRGLLVDNFVKFAYRPFDIRWLYWEPAGKLLDEKRGALWPYVHAFGNRFLVVQQRPRRNWCAPEVIRHLGCIDLMDRSASLVPLSALEEPEGDDTFFGVSERELIPKPNLTELAIGYSNAVSDGTFSLFWHAVAILHSNNFRRENSGAMRQDWARIPLPNCRELLHGSAAFGRMVSDLLEVGSDVAGVTSGTLRSELRVIANACRVRGGALDGEAGDFNVSCGWGHAGKGGVTMPGKGRAKLRDYTAAELESFSEVAGLPIEDVTSLLGKRTLDIYLNDVAYWRNVPERVWEYSLGGYQVAKKWLSYREKALLGRDLKVEEVRYFTEMIRRIVALLLLTPALDENYRLCKENHRPL